MMNAANVIYRVECHVFCGLGGKVTGRGTRLLEELIDNLPLEVDAKRHRHGAWRKVYEGIEARANRLEEAMTILIGHSYGALRCEQIATKMDQLGLPVAYVAGIDPTALPPGHPPMIIPSNVALTHEFHATRGYPARVRRRDPTGGNGGRYIFPGDYTGYHEITQVTGAHIACASAEITQNKIVTTIKELLA